MWNVGNVDMASAIISLLDSNWGKNEEQKTKNEEREERDFLQDQILWRWTGWKVEALIIYTRQSTE